MTGSPAGVVAVLRDLREARALDALKSSFVAAISHELRTPLALISGHSQSLLHLGLDAPTSRQHLERIGDAVDRLSALVDDVIDVSRIESDQLQLERAPVKPGDPAAGVRDRAGRASRGPADHAGPAHPAAGPRGRAAHPAGPGEPGGQHAESTREWAPPSRSGPATCPPTP